jgi:O-antigen/teichoic acid export membrane protein
MGSESPPIKIAYPSATEIILMAFTVAAIPCPEEFGIFAVFSAIIGILVVFSTGKVEFLIITMKSKDDHDLKNYPNK